MKTKTNINFRTKIALPAQHYIGVSITLLDTPSHLACPPTQWLLMRSFFARAFRHQSNHRVNFPYRFPFPHI